MDNLSEKPFDREKHGLILPIEFAHDKFGSSLPKLRYIKSLPSHAAPGDSCLSRVGSSGHKMVSKSHGARRGRQSRAWRAVRAGRRGKLPAKKLGRLCLAFALGEGGGETSCSMRPVPRPFGLHETGQVYRSKEASCVDAGEWPAWDIRGKRQRIGWKALRPALKGGGCCSLEAKRGLKDAHIPPLHLRTPTPWQPHRRHDARTRHTSSPCDCAEG